MSDSLDLKALTKRIRIKMEELNLNQAQLARIAGITAPALSQILNQERTASSGVLVKLAKALNESIDYLIGKSGESELSDLLQNQDIQMLYRNFSGLSKDDKDHVIDMIDFLKQKQNDKKKIIDMIDFLKQKEKQET